jgi:hypothetical protein
MTKQQRYQITKIDKLADNVTLAVEQKLWSEEDGS